MHLSLISERSRSCHTRAQAQYVRVRAHIQWTVAIRMHSRGAPQIRRSRSAVFPVEWLTTDLRNLLSTILNNAMTRIGRRFFSNFSLLCDLQGRQARARRSFIRYKLLLPIST